MAAQPARRRDLWSILWHLATGNRPLAILLFVLALLLVTLLVVPQTPDVSASLWRARSQAHFGSATAPLATLDLFALSRSPLWRVALAALTFVLTTRAAEHVMRLRRREWRAAPALAAHVGALLLLLGSLLGSLGGWRVERLPVVPGEVLTVPGHGEVVVEAGDRLRGDRPGVRLYSQGTGPLLTASASDGAGNPLGLQRTPDAPPGPQLQLRVTDEATDAYFAIPQAGLFVRVEPDPRPVLAADMPLRVQALRVPSGELAGETTTTSDAELNVDDVRIRLTRGHYLMVAAAHDPGYGLKLAGLGLTALALLVQAVWPAGRKPGGHAQAVLGWAMGVLALPAAAMALWSLTRSGLSWDGSGLQVAFTLAWLVVAGVWLFWHREVWQE